MNNVHWQKVDEDDMWVVFWAKDWVEREGLNKETRGWKPPDQQGNRTRILWPPSRLPSPDAPGVALEATRTSRSASRRNAPGARSGTNRAGWGHVLTGGSAAAWEGKPPTRQAATRAWCRRWSSRRWKCLGSQPNPRHARRGRTWPSPEKSGCQGRCLPNRSRGRSPNQQP